MSSSCIRRLRLGPVPPNTGVHIKIREDRRPSLRKRSNSRMAGTGVVPAASYIRRSAGVLEEAQNRPVANSCFLE